MNIPPQIPPVPIETYTEKIERLTRELADAKQAATVDRHTISRERCRALRLSGYVDILWRERDELRRERDDESETRKTWVEVARSYLQERDEARRELAALQEWWDSEHPPQLPCPLKSWSEQLSEVTVWTFPEGESQT